MKKSSSRAILYRAGVPADDIPPFNYVRDNGELKFHRPDLLDKQWPLGRPFQEYHPTLITRQGTIRDDIWVLVPNDWEDGTFNELGEIAP